MHENITKQHHVQQKHLSTAVIQHDGHLKINDQQYRKWEIFPDNGPHGTDRESLKNKDYRSVRFSVQISVQNSGRLHWAAWLWLKSFVFISKGGILWTSHRPNSSKILEPNISLLYSKNTNAHSIKRGGIHTYGKRKISCTYNKAACEASGSCKRDLLSPSWIPGRMKSTI